MVATPPVDPNATTRQRFARHAQDPACGTCHRQLDPLGFAMEDFDGLGKHRTQENGQRVDASGSIPSPSGEPGAPLTGGAQLARALAQSTDVADCVSVQALRFAFGRVERASDAALLASMREALRQSNGSVLEPFVRLAASPSFIQRRVPADQELQP